MIVREYGNKTGLVPAFKDSMAAEGCEECLAMLVDAGLDFVIDDTLVDSVPFAGFLFGVARTVANVRERNLLRQSAAFLLEFGELDHNRRQKSKKSAKYKERYCDNVKFRDEEIERIILLLDRSLDVQKSRIIARVYHRYLNSDMMRSELLVLFQIVDGALLDDLRNLKTYVLAHPRPITNCGFARLVSMGLLDEEIEMSFDERHGRYRQESTSSVSWIGELLCECMLSDEERKIALL